MDFNELKPTLIIGLGGTGKRTLLHLRAWFAKHLVNETVDADAIHRRIRFLVLDTDPEIEHVETDDCIATFQESEFLDCGRVPIAHLLTLFADDKLPVLGDWLDPSFDLVEEATLRKGEPNRQLGRLSLFWHLGPQSPLYLYKRFKDTIEDLLNQYTIDPTRPIALTIYVISSLCGGTGSGMFIDIAYILRQILGSRQRFTQIQGIFAMPSFYRSAPQFPLQGNTWASLKELDYFMTAPAAERRYPEISYLPGLDTQRIPCTEKPFDLVYLIDSKTEHDIDVGDAEALREVLTNALGLLTASRIGDEAASKINNVAALRDIAAGTVYSSLGVASLVFPAEQVNIWCAATEMERLSNELFTPLSESIRLKAELEARSWLQDREWTIESLLPQIPRLQDIPQIRSVILDSDNHDVHFDKWRSMAREARTKLEDMAQQQVRGSSGHPGQCATALSKFAAALEDQVRRLLNTPDLGWEYLDTFLQTIARGLVELRQRDESEVYRLRATTSAATSKVMKLEQAILRYQSSLLRFVRPFGTQEGQRYLNAVQEQLSRYVEAMTWEETCSLLGQAAIQVESWRVRVQKAKNYITTRAVTYFQRSRQKAVDEILKMDRVHCRPILLGPAGKEQQGLTESLTEFLDTLHEPAVSSLKSKFYEGGSLLSFMEQGTAPEKEMLDWGRKALAKIYDIRLESQIEKKARRENRSLNEYLTQTYQNAGCLWSTEHASAVAQGRFREVVTVIGLEDRDTSLYSGTATAILTPVVSAVGTTIVSTGDPHRLTVLKMVHGFRLGDYVWATTSIEGYRRQMQAFKGVHVFPEFNLNPYGRAPAARKELALGLAFGWIRHVDQFDWQVLPAGQTSPEVLSNKGLFDALWQLARREELVADLKRRREKHEWECAAGKANLLNQLESFGRDWIETLSSEERWLGEIVQEEISKHLDLLKRV